MKFLFLFFCLSLQAQEEVDQINAEEYLHVGEKIQLYSKLLGENREILVYVPDELWGMDKEYVLDGETQFLQTVSTVDFLSAATNGVDYMPRSIVVGISNTNRVRDLTPIKGKLTDDSTSSEGTGGGPQFLEFITTELIPYIDANYSTCHHRTIIGHSLGGLMVFEALVKKKDYFNNYLMIDTGFGFAEESYMNSIIDNFQSEDYTREHLFFAAANTTPTFIDQKDLLGDTSAMLKLIDIPNRKFLNVCEESNWKIDLSTKYYPDENHYSIPLQATYDGLKNFYDFYTFKDMNDFYHPAYANKNDLLNRLEDHYIKISEMMDCHVIPMEGYLNSFAWGLVHYGRSDLTLELLEYNISIHPASPVVYNNLGYYYQSIGENKKAVQQFNESLKLKSDNSVLLLRDELLKE